jgi:hypothetical protein
MKILSLGAGVQSSTVMMMILNGEFGEDAPRHAIFADTGWEPQEVYVWLNWLIDETYKLDPNFHIHIVSAGNIKDDSLVSRMRGTKAEGSHWISMPFYTASADGARESMVRRQCTREYKLDPIYKKIRKLLGFKPRQRIPKESTEMWVGISLDEVQRMKPSRVPWVSNHYPLIEKRMSRHDCMTWMEEHNYPVPPRSACIGCPFKNDSEWRHMKLNMPKEWEAAMDFDEKMRSKGGESNLFLHRTLVPLEDVDLSNAEDRGQLNFWNQECEGMCGV